MMTTRATDRRPWACPLPGRVMAVVALIMALAPSAGAAQSMADVARLLREGGRWIGVPIHDGRGSLRTRPVPTFGMPVRGCVQVWEGHSGEWTLEATDLMGAGSLDVTVEPGEQTPFRYRLGREAQLRLNVEWSEPRDTTLLVWVGVDAGERGGADCRPDRRPGTRGGAAASGEPPDQRGPIDLRKLNVRTPGPEGSGRRLERVPAIGRSDAEGGG